MRNAGNWAATNADDWGATNADVVVLPRASGPDRRALRWRSRRVSDAVNAAFDLTILFGLNAGMAFWTTVPAGVASARAYWELVPAWAPLLGLLAIAWLASRRHIANRLPLIVVTRDVAIACVAGALVDSWLRHYVGQPTTLLWFGYYWLLGGAGLIGGRIVMRGVMMGFGWWQRPTLIIANPGGSDQIRKLLKYNPYLACYVRSELRSDNTDALTLNRLEHMLNAGDIEHAILDVRSGRPDVLEEALNLLERYRVTCELAFESGGMSGREPRVRTGLGSDVAVASGRNPSGVQGTWSVGKRTFDILGSAAAIVVTAPLLLLIAAVVRLDGGPALYRSPRIGRGGQTFACFKFRSMVPSADRVLWRLMAEQPEVKAEWNANFKLHRDPRITLLGHLLRASSLDELPQLWNVLKGDMSLVGPRPLLLDEADVYGPALSDYMKLRPGITGLWQVVGRDELEYSERISLNGWYIKNGSFMTDLKIILRTFGALFCLKAS